MPLHRGMCEGGIRLSDGLKRDVFKHPFFTQRLSINNVIID